MEELCGMLGVTEKETVYYYSLARADARSLMNRKDMGNLSLSLGFLSRLPEHAGMRNTASLIRISPDSSSGVLRQ